MMSVRVRNIPPTRRSVLLLGGGGFIGSNLSKRLRHAGHETLATGRGTFRIGQTNSGIVAVPLVEVDRLVELIRDCRIDTVVHLASSLLPASNEEAYLAERNAVTNPTISLASRLSDLHVRLVYISSGGTVYGVTEKLSLSEEDICSPISFYGHSKLETELHIRFLERTRGLRALIIRPSNPYGPGQALEGAQGLVSVCLGCLQSGRPLQVWGDGTTVRDYIYIDDVIESIAQLIESEIEGKTLNLGSGVGHSLLDVVEAVQAATGQTLSLEFLAARTVDVPRLVLDVTRVRDLEMHHARTLKQGLVAYVDAMGYNP